MSFDINEEEIAFRTRKLVNADVDQLIQKAKQTCEKVLQGEILNEDQRLEALRFYAMFRDLAYLAGDQGKVNELPVTHEILSICCSMVSAFEKKENIIVIGISLFPQQKDGFFSDNDLIRLFEKFMSPDKLFKPRL